MCSFAKGEGKTFKEMKRALFSIFFVVDKLCFQFTRMKSGRKKLIVFRVEIPVCAHSTLTKNGISLNPPGGFWWFLVFLKI